MTPEEKAFALNGKQTIAIDDDGTEYEAIILCDLKIGISVKPLDASQVINDGTWTVPPTDPDFFFFCYTVPREGHEIEFDTWMDNLLKLDKVSAETASGAIVIFSGTCPFS